MKIRDPADEELRSWLLAGDPAVRWQVERDLMEAPPEVYETTRPRVATEGWGARLLSRQDSEGTWAGGLYSPKWTSTTYTLLTLRRLGLPSDNVAAHRGLRRIMDGGFYPGDGGINYSPRYRDHSETCITGMTLSLLAYFRYPDERVGRLVDHLLEQQMADGGWNCQSYRGDTHSSFHTTISALEGLWWYGRRTPGADPRIEEAQARGRDFLLAHHLFKSDRTGQVVKKQMTLFSFPPRWYYDVLRSLDYFQRCRAPADPRLEDAIALLRKKQRRDGSWPLQGRHAGRTFFEMEKPGKPSRMNTLRALRVLRWWEQACTPAISGKD